jgi:hypothetical protein
MSYVVVGWGLRVKEGDAKPPCRLLGNPDPDIGEVRGVAARPAKPAYRQILPAA